MKVSMVLAVLLVVLTIIQVSATIINVPDNYPTIQEGIDTSTDGDTVLVQPGTYYENINFNGHNIELGVFVFNDWRYKLYFADNY